MANYFLDIVISLQKLKYIGACKYFLSVLVLNEILFMKPIDYGYGSLYF